MKVGDEVYVVYNDIRRGDPFIAKIARVGRKFAYLEWIYRFDLSNMEIDGKGGASPGRVYKSKSEYEELLKIEANWRSIRDAIGFYGRPKWATPEAVAELLEVIGKYNQKREGDA